MATAKERLQMDGDNGFGAEYRLQQRDMGLRGLTVADLGTRRVKERH